MATTHRAVIASSPTLRIGSYLQRTLTAFAARLADVDAITLTPSNLAAEGSISADLATTGIVIGVISNTLLKTALVWILGTRELVTGVLVVVSAAGLLFVFL